jgi:2,3-bisphosphoglycerate-dependent phosphoglycerate mutase
MLLTIVTALLASSLFAANTPITTVILVRHAEKAGATGDVPLSPAGIDRAKELVRVLAGTSIAAIYVTPYVRTEQTAEPLATAHHLDPVIVRNMDTYARDVVSAILRDHKGETVVVVGHSNTTPQVIRALGVPNPPDIADGEYDGLFIVSIGDGATPKLVTLKYGAVSSRAP